MFLSTGEVRKQEPLWSRPNAETITRLRAIGVSGLLHPEDDTMHHHHQLSLVSVDPDIVICILSQFRWIVALLKFATWQVLQTPCNEIIRDSVWSCNRKQSEGTASLCLSKILLIQAEVIRDVLPRIVWVHNASVNVKLSLCFTKHYAMKTYGGVDV
jgi:hypothetical protein